MPKCLNVIHLSDLHVRNDAQASENVGMKNLVDQMVKTFRKNRGFYERNSIVLLTGDLTDSGLSTEYSKFIASIGPLQNERIFYSGIPGNHDYEILDRHQGIESDYSACYWPNVENITPGQRQEFEFTAFNDPKKKDFYPMYFRFRGHHFIGLNSREDVGTRDLLPHGRIGRRQMGYLKTILQGLKQRNAAEKVILFLHHHPFVVPTSKDTAPESNHSLVDKEAFAGVLQEAMGENPSVDVLLFGHDHVHVDLSSKEMKRLLPPVYANVPFICSSGKSTEAQQFPLNGDTHRFLHGRVLQICKKDGFRITSNTLDLEIPWQQQLPQQFIKKCTACEYFNDGQIPVVA